MYTSVQKHDLPAASLFRFCGRAGGVIVLIAWMLLVIVEFFRTGAPVIENYFQALFLAVVFIGYVAGWGHEVVGAALAIAGTLGFISFNLVLFGMVPFSGAEWFAAPGVFYLIAHYLDNSPQKQMWSQP